MKKIILATTLALGIFTLSACTGDEDNTENQNQSQDQLNDMSELVVETDAGNIMKDEFYNELKDRYGDELLREMVVTKVLSNKYDVSDEEVNKEVQQLKNQYGDQFQAVLMQSGFKNEEEFRKAVRFNLLQERVATEDIEVSEEAIQAQYDRMNTEVKASHILVDDEETANEVLSKIENGEDFAKLAMEYSTGPTGANGGDLGYFGTGTMDPAFEEATYALEVGEVSEPVKTQFGWHVIKLTDKREAEGVASYDEVKDRIKRQLASEKIDTEKARAKIDQLIEEANINIKLEQFQDLF